MKMMIHDLTAEQCRAAGIADLTEDSWMIIDSSGIHKYCVGCFGCWLKTPGRCVIKDEFQHMGEHLSQMDELLIISRATFGSYSSSVKNVLDRSISYVLPFFEIRGGEMHHRERYHKKLIISAVFYGADMEEAEKETSRNLVNANARNLNGTVGKVQFVERAEDVREVLL